MCERIPYGVLPRLRGMTGISVHKGKGLGMNAMELAAKVFDAGDEIPVIPMAVFGLDVFSAVCVTDVDGRGLWLDCGDDWLVDVEEGDIYDAETIDGVFGGDEEEWEASANEKLAGYGFRLGDFDGGMVMGIF